MKKVVNLYFEKNMNAEQKMDMIKEIGFDGFILGVYKTETNNIEEQIEYVKNNNMMVSMIHCQYYEPELKNFWLEGETGDKIETDLANQIKRCSEFGVKNFVVHLNGEYNSYKTEKGLERIKNLLLLCEQADMNFCVENLYDVEQMEYIFNNINHPYLKVCYDTGHENCLTKGADVCEKFGKYITALHIHDNHGESDEHNILGNGTVNIDKLAKDLSKLEDVELSLEIKMREETDAEEYLKQAYKSVTSLEDKIMKHKISN